MRDALTKVRSGQKLRIPAVAYNAFVDAARDLRQRQQRQDQEPQARLRDSGIVLVKNASGGDRQRFHVLGISDALIQPADNLNQFKNRAALVGVTPAEANHLGRFVILLEPLAANAIGMAIAAGVCPVQLNVAAESDGFADVKDSDLSALQSGDSGAAKILWKESGTGLRWAIVRIGSGGGAAAGLPPAGEQHSVLTAVVQNQWGIDFIRLHGI